MHVEALKTYISDRWPEAYRRLRRLRWWPHRFWTQTLESNYWLYERLSWLTGYERERKQTVEILGYEPDLQNPRTLNEKIIWKKLHVRDALLTKTTDKLQVRDYVRDKLGRPAENLLIPVLHVTDDLQDLRLNAFTPPFVLKANHGSGFNLFVRDRPSENRFRVSEERRPTQLWTTEDIVDQCQEWLDTPYGFYKHEWAYQNIPRKIFIEPFLKDEFGTQLTDVKIDCFHGQPSVHLVKVYQEEQPALSILDEEGNRMDVGYENHDAVPEAVLHHLRPYLPSLRRCATQLAADFNYCRVDFYVTAEGPYFGEITHYPACGRRKIPRSFDRRLGERWQLDGEAVPMPAADPSPADDSPSNARPVDAPGVDAS